MTAVEGGHQAYLGQPPRGLAARERPLWRELTRGVERQRLFLDFVLAPLTERGLPHEAQALTALRLGAYQLLFAPGIAAHAAVHETVARAGPARGFVNAVLRRLQTLIVARPADAAAPCHEIALPAARSEPAAPAGAAAAPPQPCVARTLVLAEALPDPVTEPARHHALRHALPQALVERWIAHHGLEAAVAAARASAAVPDVFLRARPSRGGREPLAERLASEGVQTEPAEHPLCLRWRGGASPFDSSPFAAGWFVAQDPTAVRAAEALGARAGETVLDLCAAPGTKASLLAEAVLPDGRVFAHDVDRGRLVAVLENARRLGLANLAVVHDAAALPAGVDRALVDVPCSNTGVLARRVEARRRLTAEGLAGLPQLAARQEALLREAIARVRTGGVVVYSTCSIEPEENGEVVRRVVQPSAAGARDGPGVDLVDERLTLPATPHHDGGYWALLRVR